MYYDMEKSGARIQQLRIQNGSTQEELAEKLHIGQGFLSRVESGRKGRSMSAFPFACALVIAGTQPRNRYAQICCESWKALISVPISAMIAAAAVTSIPGIEQCRLNASLCFRISLEISSSTVFL